VRERERYLFFSFSRTKDTEGGRKEIRATNRVCAAGLFSHFESKRERTEAFGEDFDQNEKAEEKEARTGKREEKTSTFDTFKLTTSHRIYYRTRRRFSSRTQKPLAAIAIIVSILTIGLNAIAAARLYCFFQLSRQCIRALTGRASISHLVLFPY
jgi:hypothetical protein